MTKYLLLGVAATSLLGVALLAQSQAADAGCCCPEGCATAGCGNDCQAGCECPAYRGAANCHLAGREACCDCCPRCGCKLVPVCQVTCTTKKTTEHAYCCKCKEICVPGVSRPGQGCGECGGCLGGCKGGCNGCAAECNACDPCNGCQDSCDCRCRVHEVRKLMVCPVSKETQVKQCTVQWVCPNCSHCGTCGATALPSVAPAPANAAPAPAPVTPAPNTSRLPPAPKTTMDTPLPEDVRTVQAGF